MQKLLDSIQSNLTRLCPPVSPCNATIVHVRGVVVQLRDVVVGNNLGVLFLFVDLQNSEQV